MKNQDIKKEFAKVILNAKIAAGIFFILLTPSIVMIVKDRAEVFGQDQDFWFRAGIAGFYTSPGGSSEWVHLYIGKISVEELDEAGGLEEEGEDIKTIVVPASDVPYMLSTGEVRSAIAIIGLQCS